MALTSEILHPISIGVFVFIFTFYHVTSYLIQYWYYYTSSSDAKSWKCQPLRSDVVGEAARKPWIPLLGVQKPGAAPYHTLLASVNTIMAAAFAALTAEASVRGWNKLYVQLPATDVQPLTGGNVTTAATPTDGGVAGTASAMMAALAWPILSTVAAEFLIAVIHENVVEYYWHRLMHLPWFYKRMHKLHHAYKSPSPFDDMYIHPLEAFGYYCILYSPPFLYSMSLASFVLYMILMGITGILDHSGVRFHLPGVYNAEDHDLHHEKFDVNYGFPFIWLDLLHGTYRGTWCGRRYSGKGPASVPGVTEKGD